MIAFTVPMEPRGKDRPRFGNGRTYTTARTAADERLIAAHGRIAMAGQALLVGPIHLSIVAIFGIPASWSAKQKAANEAAPRYVVKPSDWDNIGKLASDSLNGVVWKDDAQVADARVLRLYGTEPALHITVTPLPERAVRIA